MIIIDFYNFLYFKFYEINEKNIRSALNLIIKYSDNNNFKVIIVFDGIYFRSLFMSKYKNVELVFYDGKADDYIINHIKKYLSSKSFIVSADREIVLEIKKKNKNGNISPEMFWKELYSNQRELEFELNKSLRKIPIKKITDYEDDDLDNLMMKYSNKRFNKDE